MWYSTGVLKPPWQNLSAITLKTTWRISILGEFSLINAHPNFHDNRNLFGFYSYYTPPSPTQSWVTEINIFKKYKHLTGKHWKAFISSHKHSCPWTRYVHTVQPWLSQHRVARLSVIWKLFLGVKVFVSLIQTLDPFLSISGCHGFPTGGQIR